MSTHSELFQSIYTQMMPLRWTLGEDAADPKALNQLLAKTRQVGDCLLWRGRKICFARAAHQAFGRSPGDPWQH